MSFQLTKINVTKFRSEIKPLIQIMVHKLRGWRQVEIRTDSTYAIKALKEYSPIWRSNADENGNWYNSKGKMVDFKTLIVS